MTRWARICDAVGTALVLVLALAAIYVLAAVLNVAVPPAGVGQ